MRKILILLSLTALILGLLPATGVFAASTATVTVTAVPSYIDITVTPTTWTINQGTGGGTIVPNATYYSKADAGNEGTAPSAAVVDGECRFTATNSSTIAVNIAINMADFAGQTMTNINTGYANNGATSYGASAYISGLAWPGGAVIAKNAASDNSILALAVSGTKKFGITIKTRTDAWANATSASTTITLTATAS